MRKAVSQCGARDCSIDFDFEQQHRWAGTVTIVHPYERHDVAGDDVVDGDEDEEVDSVGPPRRKWMVRWRCVWSQSVPASIPKQVMPSAWNEWSEEESMLMGQGSTREGKKPQQQ